MKSIKVWLMGSLALLGACQNAENADQIKSNTMEAMDEKNSLLGFGLQDNPTWEELRTVTSGKYPDVEDEDDGVYYPDLAHKNGGVAGRPYSWQQLLPAGGVPVVRPLEEMGEVYQSFLNATQDADKFLERTLNLSVGEKYDLLTLENLAPLPSDVVRALDIADKAERFPEFTQAREQHWLAETRKWEPYYQIDEILDQFALSLGRQPSEEELNAKVAEIYPDFAEFYEGGADKFKVEVSKEARKFLPVPSAAWKARMDEIEKAKSDALAAGDINAYWKFKQQWEEEVIPVTRRFWQDIDGYGELEKALDAGYEEVKAAFLARADGKYTDVAVFEPSFYFSGKFRKEIDERIENLEKARNALGKGFGSSRMAAAESVAPYLPMTASGWYNWGRTYAVGDVSFAGHCHGAAVAHIQMQKPKAAVRVKTARGQEIVFSQNDLTGLATLAWSQQVSGKYIYAGRRCNKKEKELTRASDGRVVDVECRDLNPAVLHLALVEIIAKNKQSFVVESDSMHQIWNAAVTKFDFAFQPIPRKDGTEIAGGEPVPVEEVNDGLSAHRTPGTRYLVSVAATVNYSTYNYTLELDEAKKVIGGEWGSFMTPEKYKEKGIEEQKRHPDFIWRLAPGSRLVNGLVKPDLLHRLFECSQQVDRAEESPFGVNGGKPVKWVSCEIGDLI